MCRKVLIRNLNENKAHACESLLEKNDRRFTRNALSMLLSPYKTAVCRYFFDMPLSTVCHCICTAKCRRVLLHLRRLVPPCATALISVPTCPALCNHYKIKRGTRSYITNVQGSGFGVQGSQCRFRVQGHRVRTFGAPAAMFSKGFVLLALQLPN